MIFHKKREESHEDFERAKSIFDERYYDRLHDVFPRDILGVKKYISWSFLIGYIDALHSGTQPNIEEIFNTAVQKSLAVIPLSQKRKESLHKHIFSLSQVWDTLRDFFDVTDSVVRDPFFALVEDFSMDGDISKEEFILLEETYNSQWDFLKALEALPKHIHDMFHYHIQMTLSNNYSEKRSDFESEYGPELDILKKRWINTQPVIDFVSRGFYKTPGKYRKFEHRNRRMRRTFKLALLKLLRIKLWNIDAKRILDRFESWESFEDIFLLIFKIMEIINENPNKQEIYTLLLVDDETKDEVFSAEENKKKILEWESLVMKIASMFSKWHSEWEEEIAEGMLGKLLENDTDIVWEDVYFNREDDNAGIYAQATSEDSQTDDEDEPDYDSISPQTAYEMLEHRFHSVEEDKRKAFLEWEYDEIDIYNNKLLDIQVRLEKLSVVLWYSE